MATRTSVPLEPETGTELCRVKLEGGSLGGYRSDILTENLSEREGAIYKCTRCKGIMKDASISNGRQICVCCKRENENTHPHESIKDTILSLKCACPLFKRGCEWLGRLESVENHLTTCGHVYESCQLLCGVLTTRDEMGRHVREECSQREEACLQCSGVHKVCEMVEHVKVCGKLEVLCELGCGTRVRRESILCHRESECSEESVVCPYEKYRCEVVGLKRREFKQHLEHNWRTHTELKLTALEEKFETCANENELLKRQMKALNLELEIKSKEIDFLLELSPIRHVDKVKWIIMEFYKKFKPNIMGDISFYYSVAGYLFKLVYSTNDKQCHLNFRPILTSNISLEWPFKAIFITRVICHKDIQDSLIVKSPVTVILKSEYNHPTTSCDKQIFSIPLSMDLTDYIHKDCLEFGITIRILKND